jgi:hypothetical protein
MALSIGNGIVQDGLICHLDAANIRSYPGFGTTWYDISGNNFNYTLVAGPSFDSKNGGSIYFDGSNYAFCNMSWPSNFTFEIILRAQQNSVDGYARIIGTGPNYEFEFAFDEVTRQIRYYSGWTSTTEYIDYNKNINYTFTKNSSNISLYRNGTLVYQGSVGASPGSAIYLASMFNGGQRTKLNIYSFKIYNRALSATEILQNYNSTKQRYIYNQPIINNGLMVGLDFSDPLTYTGIGNTVFDLSVNTYRGTLTNGPKFTNDKNGGIIFDGVDDRIDFSSNLSNIVYNNFSFEFVAKPNATITASAESTSGISGATGKRYIFEPFNEGSNGGFGIALGTNAIECIEHGGSYLPVLLSHSANLSDINHYCVVVNDKKSRLYINGVLIKEGLQSPRPFSVIRNIASLGSMYYGSYSGTIYEFNSYSRVLSANEIRSIFEQNRGKYGIKNDRDKSGLILDLDFGNRACYPGTGTSAQDLSGFGYRANLNNSPTFSRDQRGNFQFTGTQFLTIPTSGQLILTKNDNYSLNFWVYTNSNQAQNTPSILEYTDINSYAFAIRFGISNSTIQAKAYDGVNPINPSCDVTFVFNKWNHICAVYNWSKNMIEVYMNGKLGNRLNLESYNFGTINNTSDIGIASRANFSGRIAELKIYKRALNSTEINDYYLSTKDRFFSDREDIRDGLILELDANNYDSYPGGNTWFDTSGSGLTTILSNSPSFIRGTASKIFFGSGSYGSVPYTITSSPVTIFAWFNSRSFSSASNLGALISNYDNTTSGFDIRKQSAALQLSLVTDVTIGNINFIDTVADNTWYNIAFTYNGSSLISYTNGMQFSSTALTGTRRNGPRIALATSAYDFPNRVYASDISQFRVYNRALTSGEVNTLFQNSRLRYGI